MQNDWARSNNGQIGAGPSRLALYLSALVFPGAGQFAQKRWIAGSFYAVVFSGCIVFLLTAIFMPLFWNLRVLAEFSGKSEMLVLRQIPWLKVLFWFGLSVIVYFGGLLDTVICYRRRQPGSAGALRPGEKQA